MPVDVGERLVETRRGRVAHVGDEVGQVLGALQLDAALDLGDDRLGVHDGSEASDTVKLWHVKVNMYCMTSSWRGVFCLASGGAPLWLTKAWGLWLRASGRIEMGLQDLISHLASHIEDRIDRTESIC